MGLIDISVEIPREKYEEFCNTDYSVVQEYGRKLQDKSGFPSNAYGFYGCGLYKENGKCYLRYTRGTSCD